MKNTDLNEAVQYLALWGGNLPSTLAHSSSLIRYNSDEQCHLKVQGLRGEVRAGDHLWLQSLF